MGEIQNKGEYKDTIEPSAFINKKSLEDPTNGGVEYRIKPTKVINKKTGSEIPNKFIEKRGIVETYVEAANDQVRSSLEKYNALKNINLGQEKNAHHFNLPTTFRIIREKGKADSLLVTDLTNGGKNKLTDLSYHLSHWFDKQTIEKIKSQILQDYELAAKNNICLSSSEFHPLDTWSVVFDPETNEVKVYIMDIGKYVLLNSGDFTIKQNQHLVEQALEELNEEPTPYSPNYKD